MTSGFFTGTLPGGTSRLIRVRMDADSATVFLTRSSPFGYACSASNMCFLEENREGQIVFSDLNRTNFAMWSIMWNKLTNMETIQVVLDKKLLHATDQAARQTKQNRSALVRDALREHLRRLETRAREERDRQGYSTQPQTTAETDVWEAEAVWPAQ